MVIKPAQLRGGPTRWMALVLSAYLPRGFGHLAELPHAMRAVHFLGTPQRTATLKVTWTPGLAHTYRTSDEQ
jgi:hypothetical protein